MRNLRFNSHPFTLPATDLGGSHSTTSRDDIPNRRHTIVGCHQDDDEEAGVPEITDLDEDLAEDDAHDMEEAARALDSVDGPCSYSMGPPPPSVAQRGAKVAEQQEDETDDRLSLTLEEIVHIRSVMTKAELEGLPIEVRIKEDVEKRKVSRQWRDLYFGGISWLSGHFVVSVLLGRLLNVFCRFLPFFVQVCFLCLKTRFSIFGQWGVQCKLCQKTVCAKCYTKVRAIFVLPCLRRRMNTFSTVDT